MNVFFDLDGTLIDSKNRLYYLFQHLVPESTYSFDDYWILKKKKISHKEILCSRFNYSLAAFSRFESEWMSKIELEKWLEFDTPFIGVSDYLMELEKRHTLYVVTARQSEKIAISQINRYGWSDIFKTIFVTGQKQEKYDLIFSSVKVDHQDWFVGDTGKDIQTGKLLGMKTAGVLSGFLGKEQLLAYNPDLLVENVMCLNFK